MEKILKNKELISLILLSLIVRILVNYFYSDKVLANEWGIILHNYLTSGIFGINVVVDETLALPKFAEVGEKVLPTVFMPPLYLYFIYFIQILSQNYSDLVSIIIFIQIILSLGSIFLIYLIINKLTNNKFLIWLCTLSFAFFPLNVYASSQISSVSLQIFLNLIFFYFFIIILKDNKVLKLIIFSIISGLLILIRGEFILFYIFSLLYLLFICKKNYKSILLSILITVITISPYIYRNYQNFDKLILTKSFGYNLLKGNNLSFKVEGDIELIEQIKRNEKQIKTNNQYEINLDNLYKKKALDLIRENPFEYLKLFFLKVFAFLFFDFNSTYPNYFNFFHLFPKIIISITSIGGAVIAFKKKGFYQFLSLFYFLNIFLFSIFFILPRYSLMILPVQIILSIYLVKFLRRKKTN